MSDIRKFVQAFDLGLNVDDDLTLIDGSRYINNISIREDGYDGVAVNCKGNTLRTVSGYAYSFLPGHPVFSLPSGTNTVIFSLENKEENAIIVFVHNSNGDHCIYQYYHSTKQILYILYGGMGTVGDVLNFSLSNQIDAALVGNENDKYLIWTDGNNPIRMINVFLALNYTKGIAPSYTSLTAETISFYKKPLLNPITTAYATDSNKESNNLHGKIWQFAVRSKFIDKTYSVLSPPTGVLIPMLEENANGLFDSNVKNNVINISFTADGNSEHVSEYQLLYRIVDIGSGAPGSWHLSDLKFNISGLNYTVSFSNDFSGVVLSEEDTSRYYDFIPDLADRISVLNENIVCVGGITEGYDNVSGLDVVLDHDYNNILNSDINSQSYNLSLFRNGDIQTGTNVGGSGVTTIDIYGPFVPDQFLGMRIDNTSLSTSGYVTSNDEFTISTTILWNSGNTFVIYKNIARISCAKATLSDYDFCFFHSLYIDTTPTSIRIPTSKGITSSEVADILADRIDLINNITAVNSGQYVIITNTNTAVGASNRFNFGYLVLTRTSKVKSFSSGSKHFFGIQYLNEGKPFFVQTDGLGVNGDFFVEIPYEYEAQSFDPDYVFRVFYNSVNWGIKHIAPNYATHYQWVYLGSDVEYYQEYLLAASSFLEPSSLTYDSAYWDIKKTIFTSMSGAIGNNNYGFDVVVGDRVRLIGFLSFKDVLDTNYMYSSAYVRDDIALFDSLLEFDVIFVDDEIIRIKAPNANIFKVFFDIYGLNSAFYEHFVVKIIRYGNTNIINGVYQTISPLFEIENNLHRGEDGLFQVTGTHIGTDSNLYLTPSVDILEDYVGKIIYNITDGSSSLVEAVGDFVQTTLTGGDDNVWDTDDVFVISATGVFDPYFSHCVMQRSAFVNSDNIDLFTSFINPSYGWRESYEVSPMFDSRIDSFGKGNIVNEFAARRYDNSLRHGGKLFDDSGVNYISRFEFNAYKTLDDKYGKIQRMYQRGNVLRVAQERKVTSFNLGVTSSVNPDGSTTYVFSDDIISDGVQAYNNFGCSHFSSFAQNVRSAYFFDMVNGTVVRDSVNGLDDVSFKMSGYFKDKAQAILEYGINNVLVLGGYDDYTGYYVLSFVVPSNLNHSINDTLAFDEVSNKWRTHYSFLPQYMNVLSGQTLVSFKNGLTYTHNDNNTRNNYYGVQYGSEIWVHDNEASMISRVFDGIEITGKGEWSCPSNGDVFITHPIEMQSRLVSGKFEFAEGVYIAEFMRDMLNGGVTPRTKYLANGRRLRGHELVCKLKNSGTSLAALRTVLINSSLSK